MLEVDIEILRRDQTVAANFQVGQGERFALFGPSGAGKTTVLNALAGLVRIHKGTVVLGSTVLSSTRHPRRQVPLRHRHLGLLRQRAGLFPHLSVRQNLRYAGASTKELEELSEQIGIKELLDRSPATLSGGQAQRAALARVLLGPCRALLLDEPFVGLDLSLRTQLAGIVGDIAVARQLPTILVTHELAEAQAFADRIGVIDRGRIVQIDGPSQVVLEPATRRIAELLGYRGFPPEDPKLVGNRRIGVHPARVVTGERVVVGPKDIRAQVRILDSWPSGPGWELLCEYLGEQFSFVAPQRYYAHQQLSVTILDPPRFNLDGNRVESR